jgi:hypothetical protein
MEKDTLLTGTITAKITSDFIIDLYNEAQALEDDDEKVAMLATIAVLREHIGEVIVSDVEDVDDIIIDSDDITTE